mmetsp:Transcript_20708/g.29753  ORF Transcript_20708/g.29753 Transcript_20708/m.29753 type:complete len:83 (+) Transcript_20708:210-458(+)
MKSPSTLFLLEPFSRGPRIGHSMIPYLAPERLLAFVLVVTVDETECEVAVESGLVAECGAVGEGEEFVVGEDVVAYGAAVVA